MRVCVDACAYLCVCARSRACVRVCVYASMFGVCVYVLRVWVFVCVCIWQTSPLSSVRLRMQSSPGSADLHFLRWLTALHVNNNNICSAFILLPNNVLYFSPTEDGEGKFIFIFEFFKSTVERMNQRILQLITPPWKLKDQALKFITSKKSTQLVFINFYLSLLHVSTSKIYTIRLC